MLKSIYLPISYLRYHYVNTQTIKKFFLIKNLLLTGLKKDPLVRDSKFRTLACYLENGKELFGCFPIDKLPKVPTKFPKGIISISARTFL
jgi:hypothetical protein